MLNGNFKIVYDEEIHILLAEIPYEEVTWNESDPLTDIKYSNPEYVNAILTTAQSMISSRYLPLDKQTVPAYARPWAGKTIDGSNRNYHSDRVWEEKNGPSDLGGRPVSNLLALYYHCNFNNLGGLKFWNRRTGEKEVVIPKFGEIIIIDEREDDVWHKVMPADTNTIRYVVGFGYAVN
jgi:hypothetical protein|tara:strand:+ start:235 stop:771 length:537 start_codon:yes stop_codon:yes gene_type:complete